MNEMIERVAQAMSEVSIPNGMGGSHACWPKWAALSDDARQPWRLYAAAAIEAITQEKSWPR